MPRAKFGPDPLKTVAVHKEQRNIQTNTHTHIRSESSYANSSKLWLLDFCAVTDKQMFLQITIFTHGVNVAAPLSPVPRTCTVKHQGRR